MKVKFVESKKEKQRKQTKTVSDGRPKYNNTHIYNRCWFSIYHV